jgi:methionyl-tRNA formyltransferase
MGTPGFAVGPLQRLLESGCHVVGVITSPDRPAGRGKKMRSPEIKRFLLEQGSGIPVLQPENLKDPSFIQELEGLEPDLQVVVAFRMLPRVVWSIPPRGTFNLHASLLPQYRGAAPINHVLINGEQETGVTTFLIDEQIDTGNILLQQRTPIRPDETAGELHDRLMELGAGLVLETVHRLWDGTLKATPQDLYMDSGAPLKLAPKIFKEDCRLDWNLPGEELFNRIRGLSPRPGAYAFLESGTAKPVQVKIYRAAFEKKVHQEAPGSITIDGKRLLQVAVPDGMLRLLSLQQEGKRRMDTGDFLAGFPFRNGPYRFS